MKLITEWTKEEKEDLRKKIERALHIYTILDIRVVGSYVFGDDPKDMDVVVFVDEDIEDFRVTDTHNEIVLDLWVHKKTPNLIKLFEMKGMGTFDLPQYSLFKSKMIGGKQEDIDRWNSYKKGDFIKWNKTKIIRDGKEFEVEKAVEGICANSRYIQKYQNEKGEVIAIRI